MGILVRERNRLLVEQIPHLRRYARALVGDTAEADDLVQSCLERALSRFHLWRGSGDIRAWLLTIMHNLHVNEVRQSRRRGGAQALEETADVPALPATQESMVEARNLVEALACLPEDQRAAVLLVGLEELTYRDAAAVLGIPVGTLMSRLHRGRERLRSAMAGETVTPLKRVK